VYTKLVCTKSPKCHVVLLADVAVLLFLAMNFVTAAIFVYILSLSCNYVDVYMIVYHVHIYTPAHL